jgi:hypothetical protein
MSLCGVWSGRSDDSAQQFAWEQFAISRPTFGDAEKNTFIPWPHFHGRSLHNQLRSLLTHQPTSEATAPLNLEIGQSSDVTFKFLLFCEYFLMVLL